MRTIAVFSHEDRVNLHRYKADEAYLIGDKNNPVGAYLDVDRMIRLAVENEIDAIHPGYGFLSERADFARACERAGIVFVGPSADLIEQMGDKTAARKLAIAAGLPVVPGSPGAIANFAEARAFVEEIGLPVILKAAMGGGGRGMRVVRQASELESAFERAQSEAKAAFGDGTLFIERYVERPRHIEVQIIGDAHGEILHLFERDCSVQRRHQKVVEVAPAIGLSTEVRDALCNDAVKLAKSVGYRNAGTVEFLVDNQGRHYFIEVNPRIQVEHTVTEQVTGIDIVQTQLRIAEGRSLAELGLKQDSISLRGHAIQCRVTAEDPENNFQPDTGRIEVYRSASGMGIRLDGGAGYTGAKISPYYDSLLVKVTAQALTFPDAAHKVSRALAEFRIRGVKTNIPFLQKVLHHETFLSGDARTDFIDTTPELFVFPRRRNRAQRVLRFLGEVIANGTPCPLNNPNALPSAIDPEIPPTPKEPTPEGWRRILLEKGPKAFAEAVRKHKPTLLMDTTWRDAHQSLLATRVRTVDLLAIAPATSHALAQCYALEMWGGATFDVALRFLRECPWDRLEKLRAQVPNIPFQMLLRGANAVGYTNYPDNVVKRFVRQSREAGVDIFRVFDCLNYVENLKLGMDAVGEANGVIEAAICYTGDVGDPKRTKYSLQYYVDLAGKLVDLGTHVLAIKDMAGLLKPEAARKLVGALRSAFPYTPIHVHTHDTAGTGVASMLAAAQSGADVVDVALEAMAGLTSQPGMGGVVAGLAGTPYETGVELEKFNPLNDYWEQVRGLYAGFESGQKSGNPDVYQHEMPGGQVTNLQFQAMSLGLSDRWPLIKKAYAAANRLLGDVVKVTPSSKVVGDLAQFMVQNELSESDVLEKAETLSFPKSVIEFLRGDLGIPHGGFPEPLRTRVVGDLPLPTTRPGAHLEPLDFDKLQAELHKKWGRHLRAYDVTSAALYPQVFDQYQQFRRTYSDVSVLPTRTFLAPMRRGEELAFEIERGKTLVVRFVALGEVHEGQREVIFELNGQPRSILVDDAAAQKTQVRRERANREKPGEVGAPMPGVVMSVRATTGKPVAVGEALVVMNAMKMETTVNAPVSGIIKRVLIKENDALAAGDLLVEIEPAPLPS
jgi:pyruvate carboxylase